MDLGESFRDLIPLPTLPRLQELPSSTEIRVNRLYAELLLKRHGTKQLEKDHWELKATANGHTLLRFDPEENAFFLTPFVRFDGKQPLDEFLAKVRDHYTVEKRLRLYKYYTRIHDDARELLVNDPEFEKLFMETNSFPAVILSADIRDSSGMIQVQDDSGEFAQFIQEVIERLGECVKNHFGIYDKFTGDGILSVFPPFYSGTNATLHALSCAHECHSIYDAIYSQHSQFFSKTSHGLGIGLSYGTVWQSGTESEFTTVGYAVVEACRLSGAKAGHTYVSQSVWNEILSLGAQDDFELASERSIYTAKGRDFPMKDLRFRSTVPPYTPPDWFIQK